MKVVILAAGIGKRFQKISQPKALTLLADGKSILQHQLDNIQKYLPLENVVVVVGYQKEKITEKFPELNFVVNPNYSNENTSKSLLRALHKIDEDVLWLNGDVVFFPEVLATILSYGKTSMIVNKESVGEEEVKYRTNSQGNILAVSKAVADAEGEALGINFFGKEDIPILKKNLEKCELNDYFEKAIEMCIEGGIAVQALVVQPNSCAEVDFPEDLTKANQIISKHK